MSAPANSGGRFEILAGTRTPGRCESCGQALTWARTVAGKFMPITGAPAPLGTYTRLDGQRVEVIASEYSHFATCPHAAQHRRRR